jgi:hypothetical protein
MERDAAAVGDLAGAVDVLHVGAHLGDEHAPVAVEDRDNRLLDVRLGEDEFELVAGRDLELLQLLLGRERGHIGLLGEILGLGLREGGEGAGKEQDGQAETIHKHGSG